MGQEIPYIYFEFDPNSMPRSRSHSRQPIRLLHDIGYVLFDAGGGTTKDCENKTAAGPWESVDAFLGRYLPAKRNCWTNMLAIHSSEALALLTAGRTSELFPL